MYLAKQEDNIHPHFTGNDKGLYATMIGGRIDPSSCLDTCWVDDMAVWWFGNPNFSRNFSPVFFVFSK